MKIFRIGVVCLFVFIAGFVIFLAVQNLRHFLQPEIPRPAAPKNTVTGAITKIEESTAEIVQKSLQEKSKSLKIKFTSGIKISKLPIPSSKNLLTTNPPAPILLHIEDLKVGQLIIVESDEKITPEASEVTASAIQLLTSPYFLAGKIVEVTDKKIILETSLSKIVKDAQNSTTSGLPNQILRNYTIRITPDTQVYKSVFAPGPVPITSIKITVKDLKKDMMIQVYSDTDPEDTDEITTDYIEIPPDPSSAPFSEIAPNSTDGAK